MTSQPWCIERGLISGSSQRFARAFTQYTAELAVLTQFAPCSALVHRTPYISRWPAPIAYVLLDQRPPWEINVYNTSPIGDQRHVVSWINEHHPSVVVDREDGQSFDGVPNDVRIPLVYQKVIADYEPEETVGLLRRPPQDTPWRAPAATFWLDRLGDVLDLGAVPDVEPQSPVPPRAGFRPVLQVDGDVSAGTGVVSVPISFGGTVVTVSFETISGRMAYQIPIDHLWPWKPFPPYRTRWDGISWLVSSHQERVHAGQPPVLRESAHALALSAEL